MAINKAHCMFEQSGTFKNEFVRLGIPAEDYDIQDEFGQTDHVIDIFKEIEDAYESKESVFDTIGKDDIVFAFFPCTRFEAQIQLWFSGNNHGERTWSDEQKLSYAMKLHEELHQMYMLLSKLFMIAYKRGLRLIVENPCVQPHYLSMYFPVRPKYIDKDRSATGDYYKKPTQYWFVNFDPKSNFVLEPITFNKSRIIQNEHDKTQRSIISKEYARRFILEHIVEEPIAGVVITPESN